MPVICAPDPLPHGGRFEVIARSVFLGGSIEMGTAEDWQPQAAAALDAPGVTVLNPRRGQWDASWPQDPQFGPFAEQVRWELRALDRAEVALIYFAVGTRAPISLLEMGLHARQGRLVVCCPEGFWRRGNVLITCEEYDVPCHARLRDAISDVRARLGAVCA